ncbi:MAG: hypothetical protein AB7P31_00965 [Steroidobacteraceae bacterium]
MIPRSLSCLLAVLAALAGMRAHAIDTLSIEAREIVAGGLRLSRVHARLALTSASTTAATLEIASAQAGADQPRLERLRVTCHEPVIADPRFGCNEARVTIGHTPLGPLSLAASGEYRADSSAGAGRATLAIAGGRIDVQGRSTAQGWQVAGKAADLGVAALRALLAPWFKLPEGWTLDGRAAARFALRGGGAPLHAEATMALDDLNLSNEASTLIAEQAAASLELALDARAGGYGLDATLKGTRGQALGAQVLLDFNEHPLTLHAQGTWRGERVELTRIEASAPRLLAMHGNARLALGATPALTSGRFVIDALEFPAAYTSLMQIRLAATDFGDLVTAGRASGTIELAHDALERVDLRLEHFSTYNEREFFMKDVAGELHWAAAENAGVAPSWLAWSSGGAYGLSGGASRIDFTARAADFALIRPWHMPIFDGAVDIQALAVSGLGAPGMNLRFDAAIDPISLPPLCKAFGWPEFSGKIGGRIPGVELRGNELTVKGDIEASVFDGSIVMGKLRLIDPLGKWPRLFADVRGRGLDLDLVTRAFAFGSITGRLDADILALELFGWSPVAFDARLETAAGDRSRHRISARAVRELSNVGGGGGGVAQALQSGVLQFFDEYGYDRIGLRCRLENDVCLMSGVEPAPNGYYIVKGRGLPRIDIIGNQGRVNWPQLVGQIVSGLNAQGVVVE